MSAMKRYIINICLALCAVMSLLSCIHEEFEHDVEVGEEVWVDFGFGHKDFEEITVTTKATLDITQESRVLNMYVFVFTKEGQRIYSHYFI